MIPEFVLSFSNNVNSLKWDVSSLCTVGQESIGIPSFLTNDVLAKSMSLLRRKVMIMIYM